jgi:hypothetical protein
MPSTANVCGFAKPVPQADRRSRVILGHGAVRDPVNSMAEIPSSGKDKGVNWDSLA